MYKKILRYLKYSEAAMRYRYWPCSAEPFARSLVNLFARLERERKHRNCYKERISNAQENLPKL